MKKTILATSAFCCLIIPTTVTALPTPLSYSEIGALDNDDDATTFGFGTQIGEVYTTASNGDDTITNAVLSILQTEGYLNNSSTLDFLEKIDDDNTSAPTLKVVGYDEVDLFTSTYGGWEATPSINFWTIKAGNDFTLWTYGTSANEGYWTTTGLINDGDNQPEISYFAAFNPAPIPEPTTMLLMGTGLVGLAGVSRRRKKK